MTSNFPDEIQARSLGARVFSMVLCLGAVLLAPGDALGQPGVEGLRARDPVLNLQVSLQATLGDEGEATVGPNYVFAVAPDGRFLFSSFSRRAEMLMFAEDGEFLGAIGRSGEGPGEYGLIRHIESGDRMVHVLDNVRRRWTRLDVSDWSVVDTRLLPGDPHHAVILGDTAAAIAAMIPTAGALGLPLHRVNLAGRVTASFGADKDAPFRTDLSILGQRLIAKGPAGAIWVAHVSRYRMELWDQDGFLRRVFERQVPWFGPHAEPGFPDPNEPPSPVIRDIHLDPESGLLWVIINVSDPEWHEGVEQSQLREGTGYQIRDWNAFHDTVIEVIDVNAGEVIASGRVDESLLSIGGSITATSYHEAADLFPRVSVWNLTLELPR